MPELKPCAECGGELVEVDVAGADERPALVRQNFGRHFSRDALVHVERAHACLSCGAARFFVDAAKLRRRAAPLAPHGGSSNPSANPSTNPAPEAAANPAAALDSGSS